MRKMTRFFESVIEVFVCNSQNKEDSGYFCSVSEGCSAKKMMSYISFITTQYQEKKVKSRTEEKNLRISIILTGGRRKRKEKDIRLSIGKRREEKEKQVDMYTHNQERKKTKLTDTYYRKQTLTEIIY